MPEPASPTWTVVKQAPAKYWVRSDEHTISGLFNRDDAERVTSALNDAPRLLADNTRLRNAITEWMLTVHTTDPPQVQAAFDAFREALGAKDGPTGTSTVAGQPEPCPTCQDTGLVAGFLPDGGEVPCPVCSGVDRGNPTEATDG